MEWKWKDLCLQVQELGEGMPALMLHGYSLDHSMLRACMEPVFAQAGMEGQLRRVYLDLPGMGGSNHPDWLQDADCLLDVLQAYVEEQFGGAPFLLVGESYGGYLARGLMYRMPERIRAALLLCPVVEPRREDRRLAPFAVRRCEGVEPFRGEPGFDAFSKELAWQTPHTWSRYRQEIYEPSQAADIPFLIEFQQQGYAFRFPVDEPERPHAFPTLFLTGKQDSFVGYWDAWELQKRFPSASFAALEGAGHYLQIDQEEQFQSLCAAWLRTWL